MTSRQLLPALVIPFIAWRIYLRARRNIGRQLFHPMRLQISIAVFSTVILLFAVAGVGFPRVLAALAGGLAVSVALAWYGLRLTKFEVTPEGRFYTPNTALGVAVTALFVGRILYRIVVLYAAPTLAGPGAPQPFQSPLTFFLFGITAGYYVTYAIGVLVRCPKPAT